ncbi:MAG: DUF4167 domain-containing protein [Alphaproteobacteria bacterium]|nr:DUF4167 domain-containing protein [Alphaproteobacteria bacterium]
MRQGPSSGRRSRGRHHGGSNGGHSNHGGGGGGGGAPSPHGGSNRPRSAASLRHQTFDSNGPEVRVRGNAWQVYEKYQALARDATSAGDRVSAENLLQHAEHYFRIIEAINEATASEQGPRGGSAQPFGQQPDVPTNYYTPDGQLLGSPNAAAPMADGAAGAPAQAEVQRRGQAPSPFFTQDEANETAGMAEPLVARR